MKKFIAIIIMIVGIIAICNGINSYHYANTHTWGDSGSISDRNHKAPYIEKGKNYCIAGGIITFVGVLVYFTKDKSLESKMDTNKEKENVKKLENLKKLVDNGTITKEDFENKKQELLKKM